LRFIVVVVVVLLLLLLIIIIIIIIIIIFDPSSVTRGVFRAYATSFVLCIVRGLTFSLGDMWQRETWPEPRLGFCTAMKIAVLPHHCTVSQPRGQQHYLEPISLSFFEGMMNPRIFMLDVVSDCRVVAYMPEGRKGWGQTTSVERPPPQ